MKRTDIYFNLFAFTCLGCVCCVAWHAIKLLLLFALVLVQAPGARELAFVILFLAGAIGFRALANEFLEEE